MYCKGRISFSFIAEEWSRVCTHCSFFIHSLIIGYGSCFHGFNNVHNTSMNMGCIYIFKLPFSSSLKASKWKCLRLYFEEPAQCPHNGRTNSRSDQQCPRVPFTARPHQHCLFLVLWPSQLDLCWTPAALKVCCTALRILAFSSACLSSNVPATGEEWGRELIPSCSPGPWAGPVQGSVEPDIDSSVQIPP